MRILLFNYEFPPCGGGASSATFNTGRELVRRGHHVDVLTSRTHDQPAFERIEGMRVFRVAGKRKSIHQAGLLAPFLYVLHARGILRKLLLKNHYDCGHFYFAIPTGMLAFRWRSMTDSPYLVSLRGSDVPNYDPDARAINFLHRLLKPITRSILRRGEAVIANSECLRQLALRSFAEQEISTITNGVCVQEFRPDSDRRKVDGSITALCVARLIPRKGIDVLLKAFDQCELGNLRLVIIGTGPLETALKKHAETCESTERIQFVGAVHSGEIGQHYQQADFLIHPALVESFSMTLLEAMASGLPVIASDVGGIPELVENQVNGILVEPNDVTALSAAMTTMARSRELREKLSTANRTKILDRYTWTHIATAYERQYRMASTRSLRLELGKTKHR